MKYFRVEIPKSKVNIYPLVCWHVGAKQSATKFIEYVLATIKADPDARAIYMGDAGECVVKGSKGNIYEQLISPGDQMRVAAEYLGEIKDKLLFGIRGNHGNRVDKESGVGWDELLCTRVGIPYMGVSCLGNVRLRIPPTKRREFSIYCHHGSAGAITPGGKMQAAHRPEHIVNADVAITAHTHACGEAWPSRYLAYADSNTRSIRFSIQKNFVAGSAYDSRSGYAEEKQYPIITPEHIVITVEMKRHYQEGRDWTDFQISHRKLDGGGPEFISEENRSKWRL